MYLNLSKFLFLLIIFGNNQVNASEVTDLIKLSVGQIKKFFPSSSLVLDEFVQLWETVEKIDALIKPEKVATMGDQVNDIQDKVKQILSEVRLVDSTLQEKVIIRLPEEMNLDNHIKEVENELDEIDIWFDTYIEHIDPTLPYEYATIVDFVNDIISSRENQMLRHLLRIQKKLNDKLLSPLGDEKQATAMVCKRRQSSLHAMNQLRLRVLFAEMKGLIMTRYAYGKKRKLSKDKYVNEMKKYIKNCFERVHKYQELFKESMSLAPSEFWMCDSTKNLEGQTYFKLGPIFNSYFMPPTDAATLKGHNVKIIKQSTQDCGIKEAFDACISDFCSVRTYKKCSGIVRDCNPIKDSKVDICIEDREELKRYRYVKYHDLRTFNGKNETCPNKVIDMNNEYKNNALHKNRNLYSKDGLCFCTCDEEYDITADRYFSLRPVTSDVKDNKVVLGVKLEKLNKVFYIQIKQGQLLGDGSINKTSIEWKPIKTFNVFSEKYTKEGTDFYKVSWNKRTVNLDNLVSPINCTVTGLKFVQKGDHLALSLQYTKFNFTTGELDQSSHWLSKDDGGTSRTSLQIATQLPSNEVPNYAFSHDKSSIQFTVSDFQSDLGANVVPFIDGRRISSEPPSLLSGVGLMHRGAPTSSGYLSMKLLTYRFSNNILDKRETINADEIVSKIFKE